MSVPLSQMWTVATYVLRQKVARRKRYPFVLMLEPLFRCNLACAGCGKIQYPAQILKKNLSVEKCLAAVEECGAPIVSIPGGEPLMYPEIDQLVAELVKRKKYVYLCTNAILLKEKLDLFTPSKYLSFSVHMDGLREFFDEMMNLGVEGMMVSPGYSYSKAPDQEHFLLQSRTHELFAKMLANPKKRWRFNQSPLFLRFLMGKHRKSGDWLKRHRFL